MVCAVFLFSGSPNSALYCRLHPLALGSSGSSLPVSWGRSSDEAPDMFAFFERWLLRPPTPPTPPHLMYYFHLAPGSSPPLGLRLKPWQGVGAWFCRWGQGHPVPCVVSVDPRVGPLCCLVGGGLVPASLNTPAPQPHPRPWQGRGKQLVAGSFCPACCPFPGPSADSRLCSLGLWLFLSCRLPVHGE